MQVTLNCSNWDDSPYFKSVNFYTLGLGAESNGNCYTNIGVGATDEFCIVSRRPWPCFVAEAVVATWHSRLAIA